MISHPEKLLFPDDDISKGDLAAYYEAIADAMLPHVRGRPITMERFPAGIDEPGFLQKNVAKGFPEWLVRVQAPKKDGVVHYPVVEDLRSLLWIVNQNCITPHVWTSTVSRMHHPDLLVVDLDPSRDDLGALTAAALSVRALLSELGLSSWVKTSGSKGFHIVVPLDTLADCDEVARFAHGVGAVLVKRHPELFTQEFIKADREGRILVDTGRNRYGATFAAAYAVRAKPGAPVSAPCTWEEVEGGAGPQTFTLQALPERVAEVGDLWKDMAQRPQSLSNASAQMRPLLSEEDWKEAMAALTRKPKARKRRP